MKDHSLDCIRSRKLHEDEDENTQDNALAVAGRKELGPLIAVGSAILLIFDGRHDMRKLFLQVRMIFREVSQVGKRIGSSAIRFIPSKPPVPILSALELPFGRSGHAYRGDSGTKNMPITRRPPGISWIANGVTHCAEVLAMFPSTP